MTKWKLIHVLFFARLIKLTPRLWYCSDVARTLARDRHEWTEIQRLMPVNFRRTELVLKHLEMSAAFNDMVAATRRLGTEDTYWFKRPSIVTYIYKILSAQTGSNIKENDIERAVERAMRKAMRREHRYMDPCAEFGEGIAVKLRSLGHLQAQTAMVTIKNILDGIANQTSYHHIPLNVANNYYIPSSAYLPHSHCTHHDHQRLINMYVGTPPPLSSQHEHPSHTSTVQYASQSTDDE